MFGPGTKHLGRAINQRHRAAAEALRAHQLQVERLGQAGEQRHTGPKRHRADHQLKFINQPAGSQCLREKRAAQHPDVPTGLRLPVRDHVDQIAAGDERGGPRSVSIRRIRAAAAEHQLGRGIHHGGKR